MKYLVILCDGMADLPNAALNGKTPMQCAKKPNIDAMCKMGKSGLCKTVADGMKPGSDVANLSVLGYDPTVCYTGRSPLEAASIGVDLKPDDVALRCNIVTLSDEEDYEDKTMVDYCAGDISTAEAEQIIKTIEQKLGSDIYTFYAGVSYRHCLVVANGTTELGTMTPPHDISGKVVGEYLSKSQNAAPLVELMKKSYDILKEHPVNKARTKRGERPANSIWLWGEGRKPVLENFKNKFGVSGAIVSAVDLLKGIGICAGMATPDVAGATGYIDTNFEGKAQAAIKAFEDGNDLVYIHIEAPDECGHRGEPFNKVKAIELIDEKIAAPVLEYLKKQGDFRVLVMPDHPTPLSTMTHSAEAVPYMLYDSRNPQRGEPSFTEENAKNGEYIENGPQVMSLLLEK